MREGMDKFQELLRDMRNSFLAEVPDRCEQIEALLLDLESRPDDRDSFNELYRTVHSLKGSGGTHGLVVITHVCHQLENILARFDAGGLDGEAISLALHHVDLLRQVARRAQDEEDDFADIHAALADLQPKTQQARRSILIAESSAMMAKLCQKALAGDQVQLTLVRDGLSALQELTRDRYDLLVLGRELAQLNGIAVVAALRMANSSNSQLPVIMLSSSHANIPAHVHIDQIIARDKQLADKLTSLSAQLFR